MFLWYITSFNWEFIMGHQNAKGAWTGDKNPRWSRDGRVEIGQTFGYWEVLSEPFQLYGALYVMCKCKCGKEKEVNLRFMETGRSTKCQSCATTEMHHKNGKLVVDTLEKKLLQKRVNAMKQRCQNPNDTSYGNYGGRGIEFRFESVKSGVEYILEALPVDTYVGLDLDRIDNDGHYEPGNLRLVTRKQNAANKRSVQELQKRVDYLEEENKILRGELSEVYFQREHGLEEYT